MHRLLLVLLVQLLWCGPASAWSLRYIGQQILPFGHAHGGTTVGGLSGLDFDPARRHFYAISDDRSELHPARFYTIRLDLGEFNTRPDPGHAGVLITSAVTLHDENGHAFGRGQVDPEAIRYDPKGDSLLWSSEGDARHGIPPRVRESALDGTYRRTLPLPERYVPREGGGVRYNLAFESLAIGADGRRAYVATENALVQDGPAADARQGSLCRVLVHDMEGGQPLAEYAYRTDAVTVPPALPIMIHTNGLVELLALDARRLLALERSYTQMAGNSIRLFLVEMNGATDVGNVASLSAGGFIPLAKTLLLDLASLGIQLDNIEGLSWGPVLPNGHRTLIMVSDNNFSRHQVTQFLAFEVVP